MHILTAYIEGLGLLGPGLNDWPSSIGILTGHRPYQASPDRKSTRLNSSHLRLSRMPSSA